MTTIALTGRRRGAVLAYLERANWRHPEWPAALLTLWAWSALTVLHHRGWPGDLSSGHGEVTHELGGWMLMAIAMMVPSAFPVVRHVAFNSLWHRRQRAVAVFLGSYLAVWGLFGLIATSVTAWGRQLAGGQAGVMTVALLGVAAAWELTPGKRRSLRACRRVVPLPPRGPTADVACARFGLRHAGSCVAGCWAIMLTMAAAGHAAMALMALLTTIVVVEKVAVKGARLVRPAAAALGTAAVLLAATLIR